MASPPDLILLTGDPTAYLDAVYAEFLSSFVTRGLRFRDLRVSAQYRPAYRDKHYAFWHVVSEAPDRNNRNEDDRVPDIRRCERIRWIAWLIESAGQAGFDCWDQLERPERTTVIWTREHDYAVVLAKRSDYYMLRTAFYGIKSGRRRAFEKEIDHWRAFQAQKD